MKLRKIRMIAGMEFLLMIISTFAFSYSIYSSRVEKILSSQWKSNN